MFTLFINWKVLLILLSRSLYIKSEITKNTTTEEVGLEEQVQNNIAPILKVFYEHGTAGDHDTKMRMEGKFIGALEEMGRKAIKVEKYLMEKGRLQKQLDIMRKDVLKLFVIPYFWQKFELYGEVWAPQAVNNTDNFNPDNMTGTSLVNWNLDEQTRGLYRIQAKKWNLILSESEDPLAICFKAALQKKFSEVPLSTLAKNLGLAIALMNNGKHELIANDLKLQQLLQTADLAISALSKWSNLKDPAMLSVIYEFERITNRKGNYSKSLYD